MHGELILASASPRRSALLDQLGVRHRVVVAAIEESRIHGESPQAYVRRIAMDKATTVLAREGGAVTVLAADTIVVADRAVLGKPRDRHDAADMLQRLSGRSHEVMSAVVLLARDREPATALSVSRVTFAPLSPEWIEAYCATGEPMDKAGAYAVQGLAALRISHLEGSFSGVMGLPLFEAGELLHAAGFALLPGAGTH